MKTYCRAGALCFPPSNFAGRMEYDAFPFTGPRLRAADPAVPAWEDSTNPGSRAQHSSVDLLSWAPITVTLSVLGVAAAAAAALVRTVARLLSRTIVLQERWVLGVCVVEFFPENSPIECRR